MAGKLEIQNRRASVALGVLQNKKDAELAKELGVSAGTIKTDKRAMRNLPTPSSVTAMLYPIHVDVLSRALGADELRTALATGKQIHEIFGENRDSEAQAAANFKLDLPKLHEGQDNAKEVPTRYLLLRAGRRWGKTVLAAAVASEMLRDGQRVLYIAPQVKQTREFWKYIRAFCVGAKITDNPRVATVGDGEIEALSSWNGDGLRGIEGDLIILDEAQLQAEHVFPEIIVPMMAATSARIWLIFTPPSVESLASSRVQDKTWINRFWKQLEGDSDWSRIVAPTWENPATEKEIENMRKLMSTLRFQVEVEAKALDDVPGALWRTDYIQYCEHEGRHDRADLTRVVIGYDPAGGAGTAGIIAVGIDGANRLIALGDYSLDSQDHTPQDIANRVAQAYEDWDANAVIVETNFGGENATAVLDLAGANLNVVETNSSRGKWIRAEPIALAYEQNRARHCGALPDLETEMTSWLPNAGWSPDRLDALVFAANELIIDGSPDMDLVYEGLF